VEQLAAGVAHHFNNILQGIIGCAELACFHPDLPEAARHDVERIIQQSVQATHLVHRLMDFGSQFVPRKRSIDLISLAKEAIYQLKCTLPENIQITLDIEPGCEAYGLDADPVQMQQVFISLAANAQDAMPMGGVLQFRLSHFKPNPDQWLPRVDVLPCEGQSSLGDWVALSVIDTGVGIPPEALPHIFEPFFSTKEVGKGVGLGLSQVYGILKQHGGCIDVESQVGKGTTFTLFLPALPSPRVTLLEPTPGEVPHWRGVLPLPEKEPTTLGLN
jgi:signal transduction histidine kinase